jgi:hypothetical protein
MAAVLCWLHNGVCSDRNRVAAQCKYYENIMLLLSVVLCVLIDSFLAWSPEPEYRCHSGAKSRDTKHGEIEGKEGREEGTGEINKRSK